MGGQWGGRKKAKRRNERETIVGGRREREKGEWIPFSRLLSSSIKVLTNSTVISIIIIIIIIQK